MARAQSQSAVETFWSYTKAFQALDPKAVATFFHEPALMITPQGVRALASRSEVEREYGRIMAELPAQRYDRTEFTAVTERRLGDDLVLLTGGGSWVDKGGNKFMPFGMTYTLRLTGENWRIVTVMIHAPDAA